MPPAINLEGKKFNYLTVIERVPGYVTKNGRKRVAYKCRCDCGNEKIILSESIRTGNTKSCGCIKRIGLEKRATHNMSSTRNYNIWLAMRQRCNNPHYSCYGHYGGRGITVCSEWANYEAFMEWSFSHGYADDLTLDRIDNNKGYSPENCQWVSRTKQMRNTRHNRMIEFNGKTLPLAEWADITGLPSPVIKYRLNCGWLVEDALTIKNGEVKNYNSYLRWKRICRE